MKPLQRRVAPFLLTCACLLGAPACMTTNVPSDLEAKARSLAGEAGAAGEPVLAATFRQAWRESPEPDFAPGFATLHGEDDAFVVTAALADRAIGNRAEGFNEKTWMTGDVFEIFIQTSADNYYEFHVTPENRNLFLNWTPRSFADRRFDDALIPDPGFITSATEVRDEDGYWTVVARIPYAKLGLDPASASDAVKVAFARYDTTPGKEEPVLSATAPFPQPSYHDRSAWHSIAWPPENRTQND